MCIRDRFGGSPPFALESLNILEQSSIFTISLEFLENLRCSPESGRGTQILRSESPPRARRPPKAASESCARARRACARVCARAFARVDVRGALRALQNSRTVAQNCRTAAKTVPRGSRAAKILTGRDLVMTLYIYPYVYIIPCAINCLIKRANACHVMAN